MVQKGLFKKFKDEDVRMPVFAAEATMLQTEAMQAEERHRRFPRLSGVEGKMGGGDSR